MPLDPKNLTAQITYRAVGNPPSTLTESAVSNFFPGLEFDFRNAWRRIVVGLELHEAGLMVTAVTPGGPADVQGIQVGHLLVEVGGRSVVGERTNAAGAPVGFTGLEWSNSLADAVQTPGPVACVFQRADGTSVSAALTIRSVFDGAAVARELADPGELTQSLCSPWQADYRECGCFYWAASRPDYVNVDVTDGAAVGHSWMQRDRTPATPKGYIRDGTPGAPLVTYEDLYRGWERYLRFVVGGKDEPVS